MNFNFFDTPNVEKDLQVGARVLPEGSNNLKFLWDLGGIIYVIENMMDYFGPML